MTDAETLEMAETQRSPSANKLIGLEAFRFVAAFAIVLWHYQHFAYVADNPIGLIKSQLPLYSWLSIFYEHGVYGVWIFWCVSGFIFFWKYRDAIADRSVSAAQFSVLRLSRLYPLHFVTLILVAALQPLYFSLHGFFFVYQYNDLYHFILQLFLANAWGFQVDNSFDGPNWSISVEILVYVIFFVMLRYGTRSALLNVLFILLSLLFHSQLFSCLAFFYAGGLAAIVRRALHRAAPHILAELLAWIALIAIVTAAAIWKVDFEKNDSMLLLVITPILLFCISRDFAVPATCQRLIEAAGNMTYSSYLLHFPIQLTIALYFSVLGKPMPYHDIWFFLTFVVSTLVASYFTYIWFEAPAQNLIRDNFLPGKRKAAEPLMTSETAR